jgi:hypothetical protein
VAAFLKGKFLTLSHMNSISKKSNFDFQNWVKKTLDLDSRQQKEFLIFFIMPKDHLRQSTQRTVTIKSAEKHLLNPKKKSSDPFSNFNLQLCETEMDLQKKLMHKMKSFLLHIVEMILIHVTWNAVYYAITHSLDQSLHELRFIGKVLHLFLTHGKFHHIISHIRLHFITNIKNIMKRLIK